MTPRRRGGRARRLRRWALLGILQIGLVLSLLEVLARVVDPRGISFLPETARYLDTLVREEPIGYRNRPGLEGRFWGAPVKINSLGLRDRELDPSARDPDEFRVMILGDSFPFGIGVPYEQSIPHRTEQLLNASGPERLRFRTLNMGVPSYNTEQELIQLRTLGFSLEPDAVALVFVLNDIQPKMWVLDKRRNPLVNLAQRSYAATLLVTVYREARAALGGVSAAQAALGEYRPDHPRFKAIEDSLTEIHALCRERGIPFVVFPIFGKKEPEILAMLQGVGRRSGFPVISLVPREDPRWSDEAPEYFTNSPSDSHPNPVGSLIYARLLYEGLQRAGALPEGMPAEPVLPTAP